MSTLKSKMNYVLFLLAGFGLTALIDGGSECPNDPLKVCTCSMTKVECKSDDFDKILEDINLLSRHNMTVDRFHITSDSVQHLQARLFQSISVKFIDMWLSNVSSIHDDVFKGQENSVERLRLVEMRLTSTPRNILRHCKKLRMLTFARMDILKISPEDFQQLDHPEHITGVDYQLMRTTVTIEKDAFKALKNLYTIMLPSMKLSSLTGECLPRNTINLVLLQ
ncbi:Uncharacterised protein r2_g1379 [Pycnogonum litorale]